MFTARYEMNLNLNLRLILVLPDLMAPLPSAVSKQRSVHCHQFLSAHTRTHTHTHTVQTRERAEWLSSYLRGKAGSLSAYSCRSFDKSRDTQPTSQPEVTVDEKQQLLYTAFEMWLHMRRDQISSFARNGRVHLNRPGGEASVQSTAGSPRCAPSAVVMLDTPCSEVVWRVLATHSIRQFPPSLPLPRVTACQHIWTEV